MEEVGSMKYRGVKRFIALLLIVGMIRSGAAAVAFPDVDGNAEYAEAIAYVSEAGIMVGDEYGNFNPDKAVTRAEMAVILCNMLDTGEDLIAAESVFVDVPANHWAKPYIVTAVALGVASGYGDGRFGVSDYVTYEQAVTMIVSASGWGAESDARGGYPIGYLSVAAERNYLTGITAELGEAMTRGEIAQILYNVYANRSGTAEDGRIDIPHRLLLAEDYGISDQYLPYIELYEDGSCELLINWARSVETVETEYEVQRNRDGRIVIVCAPDNGGRVRFVEETDGSWSYAGESLGFVRDGDRFRVDGSDRIAVEFHSESVDLFRELEGKTFMFTSGAGGWHTELTFGANGSFQGLYIDSDMGDSADTYPGGTVYACNFSGYFVDAVQLDNETYSMRIGALSYDKQPGTQEIRDGMRYLYSEPYGMEDADLFYVYLPGRYTGDLPQEFLEWVSMPNAWHDVPAVLPMWGLYNEGGKAGFVCGEA